jgi:hypothetical protein
VADLAEGGKGDLGEETMTHIIRSKHLLYDLTTDELFCRCCAKPFGPIDWAAFFLPDEYMPDYRAIRRARYRLLARLEADK